MPSFAARLRNVYTACMTSAPDIKIPPGMALVQTERGWEVIPNREPMSKTVAFRLPASTYNEVLGLVECFPDKGWGSAMRWLLDDDRVKAVISEHIGAATKRRTTK